MNGPAGLSSELVVFFFQAEDGIRDYKVTGVQTCALPILATGATRRFSVPPSAMSRTSGSVASGRPLGSVGNDSSDTWGRGGLSCCMAYLLQIGRASCRERV